MLSGAAALGYEVLWAREWALVYGSTAIGTAAVLVAYMTGLSGGAWLGGRLAPSPRPIARYRAIELGIAAAIVASLPLQSVVPPAAAALQAVPVMIRPLAETALAAVVLLVPTLLIGATLPAYAAAVATPGGASLGLLYAWNTIGGALGAVATGMLAVRFLGVRGTFLVGAALNVAAAAVARSASQRPAAAADGGCHAPPVPRLLAAAGAAGATGFLGLAAEVLWARGLAGVLSNSIYSVTLVLTGVLLGIVAGAAIGTVWARRTASATSAASLALSAVAVTLLGSMLAIRSLETVSVRLIALCGVHGPSAGLSVELALALLVVFLPAAAMGAVFVLLLRAVAADRPERALGRLLAVNTAGGVAGAPCAAFVLLPALGLKGSLATLAGVAAVAGAWLAGRGARRATAASAGVLVAAAAIVVPPFGVPWRRPPGEQLLFYRDGAAATVSVTRDADGGKRLRVNGQYSLGGAIGLFLEQREAHLPLLLHPAPTRLLHIGVGTGDTIGAALAHPHLHIDGIELVPEVLEAARLFARENRGALADPRVHLTTDDARSRLLADQDAYDVILADLFLPWTAGAAQLYSREFYTLGAAHLRPGGLYCQWLPLHQLGTEDLRAIVATFTTVFPEAQLWVAYHRAMTPLAALIGSAHPIVVRADDLRARLADPTLAAALAAIGLDDPGDLAVLWIAGTEVLRTATRDVPPITDDRPRLEFTAPATYFRQEHRGRAPLAWIAAHLDPRPGPIEGAAAPLALRRALLRAQLALLAHDGPGELRAYLEALAIAPGSRAVRVALAAIGRSRVAAGDASTARVIADALRTSAGRPATRR